MPHTTGTPVNRQISPREIVAEYGAWAEQFERNGWQPYLLTLMFRQLRGSPASVQRQMEADAERIYSRFVTRCFRKPSAVLARHILPVWICSFDLPVYKFAKVSLADLAVNDGLHIHVIALQPPFSRLRVGVDEHFVAHQSLYVRPDFPLLRLDVRPITHNVGYVVAYALKASGLKGRMGEGGVFVLPQSRSEMPSRAGHAHFRAAAARR